MSWLTEPVLFFFALVVQSNGGMLLIPGSHHGGLIQHTHSAADQTSSVLTLELQDGTDFCSDSAVQWKLRAGECSLHDDRAVHSSPANLSTVRRAGLTFRYSGTDVKNDLRVNPNFKTYLCRGVDRFEHNPRGPAPTQRYGRTHFQHANNEDRAGEPDAEEGAEDPAHSTETGGGGASTACRWQ